MTARRPFQVPIILLLALSAPLLSQENPLAPGLSLEERREILRRQESLWQVEGDGSTPSSAAADLRNTEAALQKLAEALPVMSAQIVSGPAQRLTLAELQLEIPANAFATGESIEV